MNTEIKKFEAELKAVVEYYKSSLGGVRANRPTTQLLENIQVLYFDQMVSLKQLGSISVIPPREMVISIWDKSIVAAAVKAIEAVHLGFGVIVDGQVIRLTMPPLNNERRAELIRLVKGMAEKERIKIRSMRDTINKKIKTTETDEDVVFDLKEKIQKLTDAANKELELLVAGKMSEIND